MEYKESLDWFLTHSEIKDGYDEFEYNWHKGELEKLLSFRESEKVVSNEYSEYFCPECGSELDLYHMNDEFCYNCGQRLNWK